MIKEMLNQRAQDNYGAFVGAMDFVEEMFGPLENLINKMREQRNKPGGWRAAKPEDLKVMLKKAREDLTALREQAKKYEAELKAIVWGA